MIPVMTSESLCGNFIERYVRSHGMPFLWGEHDGEYFLVANTGAGRLHVHLEVSPSFGDMLIIRVAPARLFGAADRPWLTRLADTWNLRSGVVSAVVHDSTNPHRIGVSARRSRWIPEEFPFEDFATFVDRTIEAAVDLFARASVGVGAEATAESLPHAGATVPSAL